MGHFAPFRSAKRTMIANNSTSPRNCELKFEEKVFYQSSARNKSAEKAPFLKTLLKGESCGERGVTPSTPHCQKRPGNHITKCKDPPSMSLHLDQSAVVSF